MAEPAGRFALDLIGALEGEPQRFGFFQALRLLGLAFPGSRETQHLPPALRFRTPAALGFPPSEITRLARTGRDRWEMEVGFAGLVGPSGILPHVYTETVVERRHAHRDGALHAFLDIFHHRACCLFYAAWRKYRVPFPLEQGLDDVFSGHLAGLLPSRPPAPGELHFAGILARRPLPAGSLETFASAWFGVPVRLEPFAGHWAPVPGNDWTRLGAAGCSLGEGAFLGTRLWDPQTRFRLSAGPMGAARFRAFLPGGAAHAELLRIVKLHVGDLLACDLELALPAREVPPLVLGTSRLGLDAWIPSVPPGPARASFRLTA